MQMPSDLDQRPYKLYRAGPRGLRSRLRGEEELDLGGVGGGRSGGDRRTYGSRGWRDRFTVRRVILYVIGLIIRQALEKAASRDPKRIRDVLASTEFTNLPYPATKVKFDDKGLNIYNQEVLAEWMKGELRTVWPKPVQAVQPLL